MINIIAAIDNGRALGYKGQLCYKIAEDLKRFKALTMGHPIIMGRKTFNSLPTGPLKGRRNIVISRSLKAIEGTEVYDSLDSALAACRTEAEVFIIGGGEIYKQAISMAGRLYLTIIDNKCTADTYFPPYDNYKLIGKQRRGGYAFCTYIRA
jgi:dihydrofolate reductase